MGILDSIGDCVEHAVLLLGDCVVHATWSIGVVVHATGS